MSQDTWSSPNGQQSLQLILCSLTTWMAQWSLIGKLKPCMHSQSPKATCCGCMWWRQDCHSIPAISSLFRSFFESRLTLIWTWLTRRLQAHCFDGNTTEWSGERVRYAMYSELQNRSNVWYFCSVHNILLECVESRLALREHVTTGP